ncbi:MAG: UvrB/UvrC motif-containing protein, partial [Candidatus Moranbacteria bacterium]|nr:UvrB/UvrC motif-containing protein [Candidatus Moranbacteria bacterium]
MSSIKLKVASLPQNPGVYFFLGEAQSALGGRAKNRQILYIGKATNLRSRVQSYFRAEIVAGRSEWISKMISLVEDIDFQQTDSVLEALILESNLIKKHQPKYNTLEKDDKSFSYFVITKEEFPRVLIVRKTDLDKMSKSKIQIKNDRIEQKNFKYKDVLVDKYYGPYTSKLQMQTALKIVRRIFPFHALKQKTEKGCLDFQLGMCPGPYAGAISKEDYAKNIRGIKMILDGKKKRLITTLEKEMTACAKAQNFEKAAELRNKIFALNHIRDVALMTRDFENKLSVIGQQSSQMRVEAYDISNISGQHAVGSMVVFSAQGGSALGGKNYQPNKSQYRKFKIKTIDESNDVGMMREVLSRRFNNDWPMPDLILLDGGLGHLNMAKELLHEQLGLAVNIVSVAKGPT